MLTETNSGWIWPVGHPQFVDLTLAGIKSSDVFGTDFNMIFLGVYESLVPLIKVLFKCILSQSVKKS